MSYLSPLISEISLKTGIGSGEVAKLLSKPKDSKHGDICFPCFSYAKILAVSPQEASTKLSVELKLPNEISSLNVVGPYLNLFFNREFMVKEILQFVHKIDKPKLQNNGKPVLVEYSSPNIAKTFHVGHLRTTLIGLSLDRVFRYLGHKVISINHLGDWGTQFGFVWAGSQIWGLPANPDVDDLVDVYVKANAIKKKQEIALVKPSESQLTDEEKKLPDLNLMARDYFIRLEAKEAEAEKFWKWCLDISMNYFKSAYKRLGIEFDEYKGESFYHPMLERVENAIKQTGVLENSEGALGVSLSKELGFVRIFTEDGRSLYITRDIAAAFYRHETFHPQKSIYVVGSSQALHFKQLIGLLKKMKHPAGDEIVHVAFGNVLGMSSRSGNAVSLKTYFADSKARALDIYKTQSTNRPEGINEDEIAEKVSIGATYFYFLSHSNIKDFKFNWDEALSFEGDSGPYCQYALARINSIKAKALTSGIKIKSFEDINYSLITDDASYELIGILSTFDDAVQKVSETYEPNYLAQYVLSLSRAFSKHYNTLRITGVDANLAEARLCLLMSVKQILSKGMNMLGVPLVERM